LLFAHARRTGGWIGWEAATLRGIAGELAFTALGERDRRVATDVEIGALVSEAIDLAIARRAVGDGFAGLAGGLGFRHAVRDALLELRTAGVTAPRLRAATGPATPAHDLAAALEHYEEALVTSALADPAAVFALALERFDAETPFVLDGVVVVAPGLTARGLPGRLLARLIEHGAGVLPDEPLMGVEALADTDAVTSDLFVAATPTDEIRELLRRTLAEGLPWDAVEIVATDMDTYGIALDAVCQQLGLAATALQGVPLIRTRIGRALERWLDWLSDGLPADTLRQALEAGELTAAGDGTVSAGLARTLRSLQIGWGRARYEAALARLGDGTEAARTRQRDEEDDDAFAIRKAARARALGALAELLERLLAVTPPVPERGRDEPVASSCHALAQATLGYLDLVPPHGPAEESTLTRVRTRLEQLAAVPSAKVSFPRAMAELRDGIADLRAWPGMTNDRKPWSAAGGMVHLTGLAHAGTTGRPRTFVVGLDAERAAGPRVQDPILTDAVRSAIGADLLPTTALRRGEQAMTLARAIGGLRGRATLSYAVAGGTDGREVGPAPVLLRALRLLEGAPGLTYKQFRERLGAPACAVPGRPGGALDGREAWLGALAQGPVLLEGEALVRAAYPMLDHGLLAHAARLGARLTEHHGMVSAAAGLLDPRRSGGRPVSPSSLELLAACPLAWFYKYGLGVRPPADPEYDPESWLDALDRGTLLHEIYERFTRAYQRRQREIVAEEAAARMAALTDEALARWHADVPPPSEAVYLTEAAELRQAAVAFLELERAELASGRAGEWLRVELPFGVEPPVAYELAPGMAIPVQGRIDRVDRLQGGRLVVIDYKTGSPRNYRSDPKAGPFRGGRRLQAAIYAAAAEALLRAEVARFEYRFPTLKGTNDVVRYGRPEILSARELIAVLLEHVEQGHFVATTDSDDCRYCDSRPICRVADGSFNSIVSPRAEWAEANAERHEEYRSMLQRRSAP